MGAAAELILNALKLEVSHLPLPTPSVQASAAASKALAVASQLADLSRQGFPLDAESIAAGILVDAVAAHRLSLGLVVDRLGPAVAKLIEDIMKVRKLPTRVDLYDDVASRYISGSLCMYAMKLHCHAVTGLSACVLSAVYLARSLQERRHAVHL